MVLWRGRLIFWQYILAKRHKYGVKLYLLCETSSYVWNILVYCGKMDPVSGFGHAESVVLNLMSSRLDKRHILFTDNFYTKRNSYQKNARLWNTRTSRASIRRKQSSVASWPRRRRLLADTATSSSQSGKTRETFSSCLHCTPEESPTAEPSVAPRTHVYHKASDLSRLQGQQYMDIIPPTEKKAAPTTKCVVCNKHGRRKETRYVCETCPSKPALCVVPCFKQFHSCADFWYYLTCWTFGQVWVGSDGDYAYYNVGPCMHVLDRPCLLL